jgi:hypothetical protein
MNDFISMQATAYLSPNAPTPTNLHLLLLIGIKGEPSQPNLTGVVLHDGSQLPPWLITGVRPNHRGFDLRRAAWAQSRNRHDFGFVFVTKRQVQN